MARNDDYISKEQQKGNSAYARKVRVDRLVESLVIGNLYRVQLYSVARGLNKASNPWVLCKLTEITKNDLYLFQNVKIPTTRYCISYAELICNDVKIKKVKKD